MRGLFLTEYDRVRTACDGTYVRKSDDDQGEGVAHAVALRIHGGV